MFILRGFLMRKWNKPTNRRRGVALIWVVITLLMLVGFAGLALDTGFILLVRNQLQNATDASALAGVRVVRDGAVDARLAAVGIGLANDAAKAPVQLAMNDANAADGDIVIGRYHRGDDLFTPTLDWPNAVKVVARRTDTSLGGPLPIIFGRVFGVDTVNLTTPAIAMIGGGTGGGIIALCPDCECSLRVNGTVSVDVDGAPIHVNSNAECAVCTSGSALIVDAPSLEVHPDGGVCTNGNPTIPDIVESPPIPDPLACLPPPTWSPANDLGTVELTGGETLNLVPGFYSGGISVNNGVCNLASGIYVLDGPGLYIRGGIFTAEEVMFYVTGTGVVDIAGNGETTVTPHQNGLYEGVSIFQARGPGGDFAENGQCGESRIIGTSLLDLQGTLYFPCAPLEVGGTGDGFGNQLIAWTMWIDGTGDLTIHYDGDEVAPGDSIFLVE